MNLENIRWVDVSPIWPTGIDARLSGGTVLPPYAGTLQKLNATLVKLLNMVIRDSKLRRSNGLAARISDASSGSVAARIRLKALSNGAEWAFNAEMQSELEKERNAMHAKPRSRNQLLVIVKSDEDA